MKKAIIVLVLLFSLCISCLAEESARDMLSYADMGKIQSFSDEYATQINIPGIAEDVLQGKTGGTDKIIAYIKKAFAEALKSAYPLAASIAAPVMLMALLGNAFPVNSGGTNGAKFVLLVSLLGIMAKIAANALVSAEKCMVAAKEFTDVIAPVLSSVITAAGMNGSAALISPSSALAGNIIGILFSRYGVTACRYALILSAAGSLSESIDLSALVGGIKKTVNWCCGLAGTLFAALVTVQNSVAAAVDSTAVKTAKYTVDSFTSIIGSGVSDAWNTYVSGVSIAKNAVGVSGAAAMLAAGIKPIAEVLMSMLLLNLVSVMLRLAGENRAAKASEQLSGVCQMALALSCSCVVVSVIIVSAAMFAGRGLLN